MSAGITDLRWVWRRGERVLQYNDQQGGSLDWHDVPTAPCRHQSGVGRQSRRCTDCGERQPLGGWPKDEAP